MRALAFCYLVLPALAFADAPPPAAPTVFLVIDNGGNALKAAALQAAVKASLGALPKGFALRVIGGIPVQASPPLTRGDAKKVHAEVARAAVPPNLNGAKAGILLASYEWISRGATGRHHLVLISSAPTDDLRDSLERSVQQGFTVSLLSPRKLDAKERKSFEERGAGHAKIVSAATLAAALRVELGWGKLSKAEEQKLASARATRLLGALGGKAGGGGLIGVLRGSGRGGGGAAIGGVLGGSVGGAVGGLGLRGVGYGSGSSRLRRGEALVGARLALTFREVACRGCDVAEVRRSWLASARSLLGCLESAPALGAGELEVELGPLGKVGGSGPAASCAASWYRAHARSGVSGKLLIGAASAVR